MTDDTTLPTLTGPLGCGRSSRGRTYLCSVALSAMCRLLDGIGGR
jgi:hypothetical protein